MIDSSTSTRFGRSRGRIQNGATGMGLSYPHPFFDIASTYMPQSMQSLFRHLQEFFLLNGFFHVVVNKLAEYPITDLLFNHESDEVSERWKSFYEEQLQFRQFQVACGLDYYTYGNALVTVRYPITKWLQCRACRHQITADTNRNAWKFQGLEFHLTCPKCKVEDIADVNDVAKKVPEALRLIRWNPAHIQIRYDELNSRRTYYLRLVGQVRSDILMGRKDIVEDLPQVYIEAVRRNEMVVIPEDEIFHMARPSISGFDPGWGCPLLLPVLKEAFQLTLMRKAQETVLLEHLIPLRVIFPQPGAGTADPFTSIPLPIWKETVMAEINRWRFDPAYMPVMPLPIGHQAIGGDGKALMVQPEMQALIDHIVVCLGVPKEFIFGGASWSGSNVSLRTVENMFQGYIIQQLGLVKFIQRKVHLVTGWPMARPHFKPFRMSDDIQRKQWLAGLVAQDIISQTTMLEESGDFSLKRETALRRMEATELVAVSKVKQQALAHMQGEINRINTKYQMEIQEMQARAQMQQQQEMQATQPQPPQDPMAAMDAQQAAEQAGPSLDQMLSSQLQPGGPQGGVGVDVIAQVMAQQIASAPQKDQPAMLQNIRAGMGDDVYNAVKSRLGSAIEDGKSMGAAAPSTPLSKPDPEQRPPRRASS